MLESLSLHSHPHLVRLLASYKYRGSYHLVFPYATENLRGYWYRRREPWLQAHTTRWSFEQMRGITAGLDVIHNIFHTPRPLGSSLEEGYSKPLFVKTQEVKFGRHGDIKPENILWMNEFECTSKDGILQIADMGLGQFHRLESRSQVNPSTVAGSPTYMPPEVILQQPISRAFDIWSLGCVFLEFCTWLIEGVKGLETFCDGRLALDSTGLLLSDSFFEIHLSEASGKREAAVKEGVLYWIQHLCSHHRCSPGIHDLLVLIRYRLLVIDANQRITSRELAQVLASILERGQSDPSYIFHATFSRQESQAKKSALHHGSSSEDLAGEPVKRQKLAFTLDVS